MDATWHPGLNSDIDAGICALLHGQKRRDVPADLWTRTKADTTRLLADGWLIRVAAAGWDAMDMFGVGQWAPDQRLDLLGLVPRLEGCTVTAEDSTTANQRNRAGATYRMDRALIGIEPRVLLWDFFLT